MKSNQKQEAVEIELNDDVPRMVVEPLDLPEREIEEKLFMELD